MMTRRDFIAGGFGATVALSNFLRAPGASTPVTGADTGGTVEELYKKSIVIDTLSIDGPEADAGRAIEAGLTAVVADLPIYPRNFTNAMRALENWNAAFAKPDSRFLKILKAADIQTAKERKKLGIMLACQDAAILDVSTGSVNDYNIQNLKRFYDLGLRVLQLTHNDRNAVADAFREKNDGGLSRLGEKVVEAMNSLGMLIDLSHCSDKTTTDAILLSKQPCAITHTGCRALYPTKRNKTDAQIRALAKKGGVVGIFNMSVWLTTRRTASVDDVVNHIEHAVKLAGVDHVSFGSDGPFLESTASAEQQLKGMQSYVKRNLGLPGAERMPHHVIVRELNSPARLLRLAEALSRRGYKSAAIEKIIGGNFTRLFREVCG